MCQLPDLNEKELAAYTFQMTALYYLGLKNKKTKLPLKKRKDFTIPLMVMPYRCCNCFCQGGSNCVWMDWLQDIVYQYNIQNNEIVGYYLGHLHFPSMVCLGFPKIFEHMGPSRKSVCIHNSQGFLLFLLFVCFFIYPISRMLSLMGTLRISWLDHIRNYFLHVTTIFPDSNGRRCLRELV